MFAVRLALLLAVWLAGCTGEPPSWDTLLSRRIAQERPQCAVTTPAAGRLEIRCPGAAEQVLEVAPIAQHCQRGPRDCEYAIDQLLLGLPAR